MNQITTSETRPAFLTGLENFITDASEHAGYDDQEIDLLLLMTRNRGQAFREEDFRHLMDDAPEEIRREKFSVFIGGVATDPTVGDQFGWDVDTDGDTLFWLEAPGESSVYDLVEDHPELDQLVAEGEALFGKIPETNEPQAGPAQSKPRPTRTVATHQTASQDRPIALSTAFSRITDEPGRRPYQPENLAGYDGDDSSGDWQKRALCAQTDPEAFFPEKGESTREGKQICTGCEVKAECLEYALSNEERFGIWGGLSERERRSLRRRAG